MSYINDWYNNLLEANEIYNALVYFGTPYAPSYVESNLTQDITTANNTLNCGALENGLFNSLSQESIQLEIFNGTNKYTSVDFAKLKGLALDIDSNNSNEETTRFVFRNFVNSGVVKNNEYITLSYYLINANRTKPTYASLCSGTTQYNPVQITTILSNLSTSCGCGFTSEAVSMTDIYFAISDNLALIDIYREAWDGVKTVGDIFQQCAQLMGCYANIVKGNMNSNVHIKEFPKTILNRELSTYAYGGCFDETEETTYQTGDTLDGNTDTLDGGAFESDYIVINDDVLADLEIGDIFQPTGVKGIVFKRVKVDGEWTTEEYEYTSGTDDVLVDISDNQMLRLVTASNIEDKMRQIINGIFNKINFPSVKFSAAVLNNLSFNVGDVVAISSGVNPTRYSYIENINTNIFGSTIISNNRGE